MNRRFLALVAIPVFFLVPLISQPVQGQIILEDFEAYATGDLPEGWQEIRRRSLIKLRRRKANDNAQFAIAEEPDNLFMRLASKDGVARIVRTVADDSTWDTQTHPVLEWSWRANRLPIGASEIDNNDVCASIYVTFELNFLQIPKSIKYTWSSTLPVGTVVDYRRLKVLVVASGEAEMHQWHLESRNVVEDYRRLYGEEPARYPLAVTLSSDSDTTEDASEADFDDLRFVSGN